MGFGRPSSSSWRERDEEAEMYSLIEKYLASREREREEAEGEEKSSPDACWRTLFASLRKEAYFMLTWARGGGKISGKDISALLIADCRGFLPDKWGPEPVFPSFFLNCLARFRGLPIGKNCGSVTGTGSSNTEKGSHGATVLV